MTPLALWAHPFWDRVLHHNTIREYIVAFLIVAGLAAAAKLYALVLARRLKKFAE